MEPSVWGKYFWTTIHMVAFGYPEKPASSDKADYKQFFENFWKVLPCTKCSDNYLQHLKELPIDSYLQNNETLFEWTVKLHNIVNKELGKPQVSIEDAKDKFQRLANGNDEQFVTLNRQWDIIVRVSVTMTALVLVVYIVKYLFIRIK